MTLLPVCGMWHLRGLAVRRVCGVTALDAAALGIVLLHSPRKGRFLMSEVPLYLSGLTVQRVCGAVEPRCRP